MPNDVGVLTSVLHTFIGQFLFGYGRIHGEAVLLLRYLALIDLALAALVWMFSRDGWVTGLVQKLLAYGFWIWLVSAWITLMPTVINGFIYLGLKAGGSTVTVAEFTNPSTIAQLGLVASEPIWAHIRSQSWSPFHWVDNIISGIFGLWVMLTFVIIAIEIFVFFLQFYIVTVLATVLIPFGINRYTGWIADGALATIVAHGIKVMVLAFLTSVAFPVLILFKLNPDPPWGQMVSMAVGTTAIMTLCLLAPRIAVGMLLGAPPLTAGVFAGTLMAAGMLTGTLGGGLGRAAWAMGRTASSAASRMAPSRGSSGGQQRPPTP